MKSSFIPIIVGPTGSGKTAVALELAKRMDAEIISADSRQIYRHLSVGTSKPAGRWIVDKTHPLGRYYSVEDIPHHLIDFLEPAEPYNAGLFARRAEEIIQTVLSAGRTAIVAGGTGLYIRALTQGLAPMPPRDDAFRQAMEQRAEREGRQKLHAELAEIDAAAAKKIPPNNLSRVIRALEVHKLTGKPISWWQKEKTTPSGFRFKWFGLRWEKDDFEKHLDARCRQMINGGLIEETKALLDHGVSPQAPALQSLGYKSAIRFIKNEITKEELEKTFFQETRQYVKRQRTWFQANRAIKWIDLKDSFDSKNQSDFIISCL